MLLLALVTNLVLLSGLQERAAQQTGFDTLRNELAKGTAPVGPTGPDGRLLALGTPVALLTIDRIGLRDTVVFEGTTSGVLTHGPGHRRDTVLPGQVGTSVLMGRAAAYGAPFGDLDRLGPGDAITVTTGQGRATFRVIDKRVAGDPVPPPPAAGHGRLTLVTARGAPFLPDGLLRVDADLVSAAQPAPPQALPTDALGGAEQALGHDTHSVWALVLWLQALLLAVVGAVWSWYRWGRWQTWIVFVPVTLLVGLFVADQATLLLPNLM